MTARDSGISIGLQLRHNLDPPSNVLDLLRPTAHTHSAHAQPPQHTYISPIVATEGVFSTSRGGGACFAVLGHASPIQRAIPPLLNYRVTMNKLLEVEIAESFSVFIDIGVLWVIAVSALHVITELHKTSQMFRARFALSFRLLKSKGMHAYRFTYRA